MATVSIPLHSRKHPGRSVIIDEEDLPLIRPYKWHVKSNKGINWYAMARSSDGKTTVVMHRLILDAPKGIGVDHINGDGLDNRRCNLRLANHNQNMKNARTRRDSKSGFKGVYKTIRGKYCARLTLGSFDTAEDAAREYDRVIQFAHGEFAYLNFPKEE